MKKRQDPCTPEARLDKKQREYASPKPAVPPMRTLLRNPSTAPAAPSPLAHPHHISNTNDDEGEKRRNRAVMLRKKKQIKHAIMSPVVVSSPKAVPPASMAASRQQLGTPRSNLAVNRPLSNAEIPKLSAEQISKTFEDWMRIAADNVASTALLLCRKSTQRTHGTWR